MLLLGLAASMLLPAALEALSGGADWQAFLVGATITGTIGGALVLGFRAESVAGFTAREGFVLTVASWTSLALFATLPFMLSVAGLDFTDAIFESMSGLTTTGASVMSGLDAQPRGILLWRAMLHWFGGIGIVVMAVAILPALRVGGMQLFRTESSDKLDKIRPRVSQVSTLLLSVYLTLTVVCAGSLLVAGMPLFDAICHAMSTVATGGFSTRDASIGAYGSASIEWLITGFMFVSGIAFALLAQLSRGNWRPIMRDIQVRTYAAIVLLFIVIIALWQIVETSRGTMEAIRASAFNVVSIITGTGFSSEDYLAWGTLPHTMFLVLLFIGGCTGSTSGGIKVFRYCILGSVAHAQLRHLIHPHRVIHARYNRQPIDDEVVRAVLGFFIIYGVSVAILTMALSTYGIELVTSLSAVAQAIGNVGPGLSADIGPLGNYGHLADGAKWILSFGMLLGRLELLTVLVLFSPTFWRG
jgi:trk system potassium uptake protein TrkH